ncbi:hypothetical protein [Gloeocapsopsis sp. IPPAS B-1203]
METQLLLAQKFKYISSHDSQLLLLKMEEAGRMLRGLQRTLKAKLNSP